ncbi:MAG: hypothetical protein HYS37_14000 [Candidatus Rokubacteria bacterium]|nr:hypothetical protein [Candidatus Rokubacteria bacterium]
MRRPSRRGRILPLLGVALLGAAALGGRASAAGPPDRLDRFRELAAALQAAAPPDGGTAESYRELYALLDEEIVESLATGGPFASAGFLQDRLDAFGEVWGAAALGVARAGRLVVGAFQWTDAPGANTIRVYGRLGAEPALLATLQREGRPTVYPVAPGPRGAAQFLAAWEGPASGRGTRPLRLELARERRDGVSVVWRSADAYREPLLVRSYAVGAGELRVRYELRYPGWTPGCEVQAEAEDVWRLAPESGVFARAGGRQYHAWHRELHATAARFFEAVAAGDAAAVAALVPDAELRRRLPRTLRAEPACDAVDDEASPRAVSVAARADRAPWDLRWERAGARWRLTAAAPVLQ